jgi:predicted dienelactone hydrolase
MLTRRHLLQSGLVFTATRAWSAPQSLAWQDPARGRELPLLLRLPGSPGPWPWVLYSHGLGGNREGGWVWGQAWADAGFAVLHLQHPGSDSTTLRQGLRALRAAASAEQLNQRVADVVFVLDEVARQAARGAAPWSQLRLDAVGMAGHSFGARTTQSIAGERLPVPGGGVDARPKAFVALSPSAPRQGSLQQAFGAIRRPMLLATGSNDGDPFDAFTTGEPRAGVYQGLPEGQRALLWLQGADHMSFAGGTPRVLPRLGPFKRVGDAAELESQHHALLARISTLWWRQHLSADADAAAQLREIQAQRRGLAAGDRLELG